MQGKQLKRHNIYQYTYYAQKWHCCVYSEEKFPLFVLLQAELDEARFYKPVGALCTHNGRYLKNVHQLIIFFFFFFSRFTELKSVKSKKTLFHTSVYWTYATYHVPAWFKINLAGNKAIAHESSGITCDISKSWGRQWTFKFTLWWSQEKVNAEGLQTIRMHSQLLPSEMENRGYHWTSRGPNVTCILLDLQQSFRRKSITRYVTTQTRYDKS